MPYKKSYRIQINPANTADIVTIDISRKSDFVQFGGGAFMQVISLNDERGRTPEGSLTIKSIDNSEDKFTKIKAKQAVFSFFSNNAYNLNFFAEGEDDEWVVVIYMNNAANVLFRGFLDLSTINEDFQPYPNVVTLTATDNIGLLKDIPLTKADGTTPRGKFKVIEFISWALQKTNLQVNINCVQNLMEENNQGITFYESCYLDAKTFEKEIGECEDCYTVLEKILGQDAMLCQWMGEWWIVRIDEMQAGHYTQHIFDYTGAFIQQANNDLVAYASGAYPRIFLNDDANVSLIPKHGEGKETYNYDFPREIVDNIDFSRGDANPFYTANDGAIRVIKRYTLEDWTMGRYKASSELALLPSSVTPYIERIFEDDYEKERYVVIPYTNSEQNPFAYIRSNPIPVSMSDKGSVSVDFKFTTAGGVGDSVSPFALILKGDDGKYYYAAADPIGQWYPATNFGNSAFFSSQYKYFSDTDKTQFQTASLTFKPVPVSGQLYIYLVGAYNWGNGHGNVNAVYQNLRFDYQPYINGSYAKYRAQYNRVYTAGNYKSVIDEQVYMSDSPKKLFKGALFTASWDAPFLTGIILIQAMGNKIIVDLHKGNIASQFPAGLRFKLSGTASNNGEFTVASASFDGSSTIIIVSETTVDEAVVSSSFQQQVFSLAGRFYNGAVFPAGPPDDTYLHPFGFIQAYSVWNQFNRTMRLIDCTISNLDDENGYNLIPDLPFNIRVADVNPHTTNKYFMPMHVEQDYDNNQMRTKLAEVWDEVQGKAYTDPFEFRYISDNG